ncbi:MAG: hypothetical protein EDQ89_06645 [Acidobacteria bacterium]|nr:MAG: hypothetical protein EDQ89_06645 [Acidobacteriota bacterium]GIK77686.1 MAG: hypothetical protein BroJett022_13760 [Actinomycetes bacterium]
MAAKRPRGGGRRERLTARLERLVGRTSGRLVLLTGFAAALWALTALAADLIDAYPGFGESLWSGVRHMLDPGALGDDATGAQRAVGLIQVLTGIVLVVGLALTVLSDLVDRMLHRLAEIDPPVTAKDHLLVIGCGGSLPAILARFSASGWRAPVVVLVPPGPGEERRSLRQRLTEAAPALEVRVVSGDAFHPAGLARGSAAAARSIVILSRPGEDDAAADVLTIQIGAVLAASLEAADRAPQVGIEMRRGENVDSIWELFPPNFDAIVHDRSAGSVLGLAMANPSFTAVIDSASYGSDAPRPFLVGVGERAGSRFAELAGCLPAAVPVGLISGGGDGRVRLVPGPDTRLEATDRVIVLARSEADARRRGRTPASVAAPSPDISDPLPPPRPLLVGWSTTSADYVGAVAGADGAGRARTEITVLASADPGPGPEATELRWRRGDPSDPSTLRDTLAAVAPDVVLVASVGASADPRVTDARAALAALHLCRAAEDRPLTLLVEQRGAGRAAALERADPRIRVVSAAAIAARAIALAAVDPDALAAQEAMAAPEVQLERRLLSEAGAVAAEPDGALRHRAGGRGVAFAAVYRALLDEGAIPIGVARDGVPLESLGAGAPALEPGDELLVLRRAGHRSVRSVQERRLRDPALDPARAIARR